MKPFFLDLWGAHFMGIFKDLFGGEKKTPRASLPASGSRPPAAQAGPAKDPNMLKVFDAYGRELFVTRDTWRQSILPGAIEKASDDPEQLAGLITQLLYDSFFEEALAPARRLLTLQPDAARSSVLLAVACLKLQRLDEAQRVLADFLARHGDDGVALTNLAKVYEAKGEKALELETLRRGLRVDPNQENGLQWYVAIQRDSVGDEAAQRALVELAALPAAWRPQLWLARTELKQKNLPGALRLYHQTLENIRGEIPSNVLMQISGDLGNQGHLTELLELTAEQV